MIKLLTCLIVLVGLTPQAVAGSLHNAAKEGDVEAVKALIADGEDINKRDRFLGWPIHQAALNDFVEIAELLIEAGADVNVEHRILGTPLHAAAHRGSTDTARLLLNAGATLDTQRSSDGYTALHLAAAAGNADLVDALVSAGADINARRARKENYTGRNLATHEAGLNGHFEIIALLRSLGMAGPAVEPIDHLIEDADSVAGEAAFHADDGQLGCRSCHTTEAGDAKRTKFGPDLAGIVGRQKASVSGYEYSEALKRLGGIWTTAELNVFIAATLDFVPGSSMDYNGISDAKKRADIIAYLVSISR